MKTIITLLNLLSILFPKYVARVFARLFQTPTRRVGTMKAFERQSIYTLEMHEAIAYHCWNRKSEKTVLLIHGWSGNWSNFELLISYLIDGGFEVIAIDGPAHGLSDGKRANPFLFADTIEKAVRIYGQPYALVGHSMGGGAAAIATARKVVSPEKLILIASPSDLKGVLLRFGNWAGMRESLLSTFLSEMKEQTGYEAEEVNPKDLGNKLSNIQGLIIHCRDDKEIPFHDSLELSKYWKPSRLLAFDNLGHRRILKNIIVCQNLFNFIERD